MDRLLQLATDGRQIVSGGGDGTVRLWDETGRLLASWQGHARTVFSVGLSGNAHVAAGGGEDGRLRLWEAGVGRPISTLQGQTGMFWRGLLSAARAHRRPWWFVSPH